MANILIRTARNQFLVNDSYECLSEIVAERAKHPPEKKWHQYRRECSACLHPSGSFNGRPSHPGWTQEVNDQGDVERDSPDPFNDEGKRAADRPEDRQRASPGLPPKVHPKDDVCAYAHTENNPECLSSMHLSKSLLN